MDIIGIAHSRQTGKDGFCQVLLRQFGHEKKVDRAVTMLVKELKLQ